MYKEVLYNVFTDVKSLFFIIALIKTYELLGYYIL